MLDTSQILTYSAALAVAAAIPGPGMAALVARSVGGGALSGFCLLFGIILGDLTYLSFAVFGLAMVAEHFNGLFQLVRWAAAVYLCYLAWLFWFAEPQAFETDRPVQRKELLSAAVSGLTITLGNPKTIAFYLALLPLVINLESVTPQTWGLMLVPLTALVLLAVGAVYILGAVRIRHLLSSLRAQQRLFRGAAAIMVAAAAAMLIH
ncbi:LysE family translocator [Pseudomonas eucalypticola]|uniref:LysE family translocator n=1 Tax=Pseudomonas eucalypticola TaxID=2599595 RepID=A0A7D5D9Y2_9PSED|nr:LysE family translocator [Pseudomonas eucalypticola]QKZ07334.1 LysE family translocator [Pseudomonas eucalypticola]